MPICIECRYPVKTLYTEYSKADDRALGKGVRLTQCPRCKKFADKYVEHDFVVLFIDLVLIKPQVRQRITRGEIGREADGSQRCTAISSSTASAATTISSMYAPLARASFRIRTAHTADPSHAQRSIIRLGILLLLFDVYLTWARIEKLPLPPSSPYHHHHPATTPSPTPRQTNAQILQAQPLILQYLFFLLLVSLSTLAFHLPIRLLTSLNPANLPTALLRKYYTALIPYYPHPTPLSTALLVSSCTKLFPILLIIWEYDLPSSATAVSWAVIANNVAALEILMDCGYVRAGVLVGVGAGIRWVVAGCVVREAGLGRGWEEEEGGWFGGFGDGWTRGGVGVG
jgi:hypothetical protein